MRLHPQTLLTWQRNGAEWLLTQSGIPRARIARDEKRWLCYLDCALGDEGYIGPARSLAHAKSSLANRLTPLGQAAR